MIEEQTIERMKDVILRVGVIFEEGHLLNHELQTIPYREGKAWQKEYMEKKVQVERDVRSLINCFDLQDKYYQMCKDSAR